MYQLPALKVPFGFKQLIVSNKLAELICEYEKVFFFKNYNLFVTYIINIILVESNSTSYIHMQSSSAQHIYFCNCYFVWLEPEGGQDIWSGYGVPCVSTKTCMFIHLHTLYSNVGWNKS
jgi:hypothetical protein